MASLWPIISLWGTANALEWAHCIGRCCCRWLRFGSLFFWEVLPMHSDGPIALADAAANGFALAHYFSEVLPMHSIVPIALVNAAANGFTLIPKYGSQICFRYRWIAVKQNVPLDLLFSIRFRKHTLLYQPIFYLNYAATQCASAGGVCADRCP